MHHDNFRNFNPPAHEVDQMQAEAIDALRESQAFILVVFEEDHEPCEDPNCGGHQSATLFGNCNTIAMMQANMALQEQINTTHAINLLANLPDETRAMAAAMIAAGLPDED